VRQSAREQQILRALAADDRELHGPDLVEAGAARVSWLYVVLARMEDCGWIEGRFEDGDPPRRRLYRITDAGRDALTPALPVAKVR
jgi:PadR family transcriptional regulator PadR